MEEKAPSETIPKCLQPVLEMEIEKQGISFLFKIFKDEWMSLSPLHFYTNQTILIS